MATADEILTAEFGLDDTWFEVDLLSRQIVIPKRVTNLGVKSDKDVMHARFKLPRFYYGVDFSEFKIGIDYTNAQGEEDRYEPKDVTVTDDVVTFTWVVGKHAALYKGTVTFGLCIKRLNPTNPDDPHNEFHTTKAALPILDGMETCEEAIGMYTDLLEQWREQLFGEKDSLIADIETAAQAQQKAIENKAAEALATIPADYTETYRLAQDSVRTRATAIVCVGEGETANIQDASGDSLRGLRVFGKTNQVSTTGKNLLQITASSGTVAGITYTVNPDGTVIASGTATEVSTLILNSAFVYEAGVGYTLNGCPSGGGIDTYRLDDVSKVADDGAGGSVVYAEDTTAQIRIRIAKGATVNNLLFKPMIRLTAIEDNTFEPYSGGLASPSPSWSQPMVPVDSPAVKVCTSNIFGGSVMADKIYSVSKATTSVKDESAGTVTYSGGGINSAILFEGPFKPNQQYTLILYGQNTTAPDGFSYTNLVFLYDDCTVGPSNPKFVKYGEDSYSIITSDPGKTVKALIGKWASGSVTLYYDKSGLFEGVKTVDDFEPYREQSLITVCALYGIPVTTGGNYTGDDGQQWFCDEVDFERGVYVQRCYLETLRFTPQTELNRYSATLSHRANINVATGNGIPVLCETHMFDPLAGSGTPMVNGIRIATTSPMYVIAYHDGEVIEEATVLYPLETPIETPLAAEEIEAYKFLQTNYPNTIIMNDSGAWMEVKYNADTKTYLDRLPKATDAQVQAAVDAWLTAHFANAEGVSF